MIMSLSKRRKVCVVITSRASYARVRTALTAIRQHPQLELQLVAGSSLLLSRYGNALDCITADGFRVDAEIFNVVEGENLITSAKSTGLALTELATALGNLRPDIVMSIADRYETLATAVAAAYMNIPLVHLQGGELSGSIDEKVRHAVTKLADLHLACSPQAAERIVRMGEPRHKVHVTGCPSVDLAYEVAQSPALDFDPLKKYGGVGADVDLTGGFLIVMQHPVTTEYTSAREQVVETLFAVRDVPLSVLWFWPNVDAGSDATSAGIRQFREQHRPANLRFFKHMDSLDFLRLAANSRAIVGNSSVGIRECAFLGVPVVNIGSRQRGRDRGRNVVDVPHRRDAIRQAIDNQLARPRPEPDTIYGDGHAGARVAQVLATTSLEIEKTLTFESDAPSAIAAPAGAEVDNALRAA